MNLQYPYVVVTIVALMCLIGSMAWVAVISRNRRRLIERKKAELKHQEELFGMAEDRIREHPESVKVLSDPIRERVLENRTPLP